MVCPGAGGLSDLAHSPGSGPAAVCEAAVTGIADASIAVSVIDAMMAPDLAAKQPIGTNDLPP